MNAHVAKLEIAKPTLEEFFMAQISQRRDAAAKANEERAMAKRSAKQKRLFGKPVAQ